MTDTDLLSQVIGTIDPGTKVLRGLYRSGRLLLALPTQKEAAMRALRLYQPQRLVARVLVAALRGLGHAGWQNRILPCLRISQAPTRSVQLLAADSAAEPVPGASDRRHHDPGTGADTPEQLAAAWAQVSDRSGEQVPASGAAQGGNEVTLAMAARR